MKLLKLGLGLRSCMMSYRKTIAITGGAGFIGSHLCDRLVKNGDNIICIDNFYTGYKENIMHLMKEPNFELLRHDITMPLYIEVDEIYNLACPASPVHYQKHPIQTTQVCVKGSINMLELAKRTDAKILQASTSEIYGDPEIHPQVESYYGNVNIIGPRACYDEGKRCAETLFFDYWRQEEISIKVARIFNTYGPRMSDNDGRVISNFIIQALKNKDITVFGDGGHTRSFCYVDDLVNGLIKLMGSEEGVTGPINLGNTEELTIMEVAKMIIGLTCSSSKIIHKMLPEDDPSRRQPDISLAKELLGWEPRIFVEEGLGKTIDYFFNRIEKNAL